MTVTERTAVRRDGWEATYSRRLVITDVLALVWVVFGVQIAWFGFDSRNVTGSPADLALGYTTVSVVLVAAWLVMLALYDTRDPRYVGTGAGEYRRIVDSAIRLFALVAIIAYAFKLEIARGYIFIAFPVGVLLLVLTALDVAAVAQRAAPRRTVLGARRPGGLHDLRRAHRP